MFRLIQSVIEKLITVCTRNGSLPFWENDSFPWGSRVEANSETIRNEFDSKEANLGLDGKPFSRPGEWKWFFSIQAANAGTQSPSTAMQMGRA